MLSPAELVCGDEVKCCDIMLYPIGHHLFEELAHALKKGDWVVGLWEGVVGLVWFGDDDYYHFPPSRWVVTKGEACVKEECQRFPYGRPCPLEYLPSEPRCTGGSFVGCFAQKVVDLVWGEGMEIPCFVWRGIVCEG